MLAASTVVTLSWYNDHSDIAGLPPNGANGPKGRKTDKMSFDEAQCAVVQSLQNSLTVETCRGPAERAPGSRHADNIERAIDYALSPRRKQRRKAFLESDVLRNARFAEHRSKTAEAGAVAEIAAISAPPHQAFDGRLDRSVRSSRGLRERPGVHTAGPGGRVAGTETVGLTTPEHIVIVRDLEERLRATVATEDDPLMSSVLDSMLVEDTISESSRRLGVSARTVSRVRARVRVRALEVLSPEAETMVRQAWDAA